MTRRVLVTGGGKGVGAAVVRSLAADGFDIDFTYRSSADAAKALLAEMAERHPGRAVRALELDLADAAAVDAFCAEHEDAGYYGLVHNAGQSYDTLVAMLSRDKADAVMQVNFWSMTALVKAFVRGMIRQRAGRIVAIGSVTAIQANPGNAAYAASKAALTAYLRTLALESAKRGITVNTVAPGFIDTDMMARYGEHKAKLESQIPVGRFARPGEIAALVTFLLQDAASYLTGAVIPVDGGLSAQISAHR